MFGHRFFGNAFFSPHYFGPADQSAAVPQVLNYGVMRRRREEYEAQRREAESLDEFAHEVAARIDEGLPEPLRPVDTPEPVSPGAGALDAATLALSRAAEALTRDETAAARIAVTVEAQLRRSAPPRITQPSVAAIVTALCDDDDEEEAILALLLAA